MLESSLAALIKTTLDDGLAVRSLPATVKQGNQPRQVGTLSTPEVTFFHISTVPVGWPERKDEWDQENERLIHKEIQNLESRWQMGAVIPQVVTDSTLPTAADYLRVCVAIFQSNATLKTLVAQDVGIQHISLVRSVWYVDDKGQNAESPSFDVILAHQDIFITETPVITAFKLQILEV